MEERPVDVIQFPPGGGERGLQPAWGPRDCLVDAEVAQHGLDVGIDGVLESFGDSSSECRVFRSVLSVPSYREVFWEQAGGCQVTRWNA